MTTQAEIDALHRAYVNLTGLEVPLNCMRRFAWENFIAVGFKSTDLTGVIKHIQTGIRSGTRRVASLRFDNLIERTDRFEMDVAEVRSKRNLAAKAARPRPRPTRAEDLTHAGKNTAVPVSETALKILRDFREANK